MTTNRNVAWPTRPSGSKLTTTMNRGHGKDRQAVMVPDFVANFIPAKYGYQEVHGFYDEMRLFFAKKAQATSASQAEVATIKVTLMTLKPNNKNPQVVSVCKIILWLQDYNTSTQYFIGCHRIHHGYSPPYRG